SRLFPFRRRRNGRWQLLTYLSFSLAPSAISARDHLLRASVFMLFRALRLLRKTVHRPLQLLSRRGRGLEQRRRDHEPRNGKRERDQADGIEQEYGPDTRGAEDAVHD